MEKKGLSKKLTLSGVLIAIATIFGTFSIPIFGARMSPVQHFINVVTAVTLGPGYAVGNAFIASTLRNILGTGSLLAFPGSMIGAFLSGVLYKKFNNIEAGLLGEIIGTGFIGALVAYPISNLILGKEVALFAYVIPFCISCVGGGIIAYTFLKISTVRKVLFSFFID
ncbi:MAG: energy coupling factor transporter S component ThiW [Clostridium sp.]|uniref:energy coupling factor transporter S component ThiW n=1 Tax=Clostridium sp. TaxID=1506 RepID=UPI002909FEDA|nr:energy coupling factor transporter S component ThiW [Clostridium sp.]MDU4939551.1 energy coupling factor transporter S component ThiW [Clostridium sp.]